LITLAMGSIGFRVRSRLRDRDDFEAKQALIPRTGVSVMHSTNLHAALHRARVSQPTAALVGRRVHRNNFD
jgi:hypothetical protein